MRAEKRVNRFTTKRWKIVFKLCLFHIFPLSFCHRNWSVKVKKNNEEGSREREAEHLRRMPSSQFHDDELAIKKFLCSLFPNRGGEFSASGMALSWSESVTREIMLIVECRLCCLPFNWKMYDDPFKYVSQSCLSRKRQLYRLDLAASITACWLVILGTFSALQPIQNTATTR